MDIRLSQSFDTEFCALIYRLWKKYPPEIFTLEGIHPDQMDMNEISRSFFKTQEDANRTTADHSIDANANVSGRDVITFNYEVPKSFMKLNSLYNLWRIMREQHGQEVADSAIESELSGFIYINDAWDIGRPYCFNYSTLDIALEGLPIAGRLTITRPRSLSAFLHQVEQFTTSAANMTLGATGLADLLITASWYVDRILETRRDHHVFITDVWTYVRELLAHFIYTANYEFRGNQSPFTNVSVYDDVFLEQLLPAYVIDGKAPELATVQNVQRAFLEVFNHELDRNPLTFPVVTACVSVKIDEKGTRAPQDATFVDMIATYNMKYGFINIYCGETSTLSSCCRLRSDASTLGYANTFGAGSTKIGSLGVVTINLPRLALLLDGKMEDGTLDAFIREVWTSVTTAAVINNAKREFIKDRIQRGALPLYSHGFMHLDRQYSTCGFTGLWEALNILGYDITTDEGLATAKTVLDAINAVNAKMTKKFKTPHNMEQVPAESSAVKLAAKDALLNIVDAETGPVALYSNQFVPLWDEDADLLDRIRVQGALDAYCTGGAICHLNIMDRIENFNTMKALILHACESGVVYFAVNYTLNRCPAGHMTVGHALNACPVCGKTITDTYTRVVGFLTNTKHWNRARREEDWPNRVFASMHEGRQA